MTAILLSIAVAGFAVALFFQVLLNRDLRRQLADAEEDIEELEAGRGQGDVRILEVRRRG